MGLHMGQYEDNWCKNPDCENAALGDFIEYCDECKHLDGGGE